MCTEPYGTGATKGSGPGTPCATSASCTRLLAARYSNVNPGRCTFTTTSRPSVRRRPWTLPLLESKNR